MRRFRLSFGLRALYLSAFFLLIGNAIQNVYVPIRAVELGFGTFGISLLGSLYFFGFIVGCLFVPRYLNQVGHIRTFAAFAALAGAVAIVMSLFVYPSVWIPLRFLTGFSLAGLYLSIESWISAFSEDHNRGKIISVYRLTDLAGAVIGQLILFRIGSFEGTLSIVALLLLLSLIPITLTQIQMPSLLDTVPETLLKVCKKTHEVAPLSIWGAGLSGVVSGVFWTLIPLFVLGMDLPGHFVPLVVACYLIGGAISQWPVGIWSDRIDRRVVIMCLSALSAIVSVMITIGAHTKTLDFFTLLFLIGLFGAGAIPVYAISVAHANDWAKKVSVVDLSVLLLVSSSVGSVLGPLVIGSILEKVGRTNLFLLVSFAHGILFLEGVYRIVRVAPMPIDKKTEYLDLPETTPMIARVATPTTQSQGLSDESI